MAKKKQKKQKKQKTQLAGWKRTVALWVLILVFLAGGTMCMVTAGQYLKVEKQDTIQKNLTYQRYWDGWHNRSMLVRFTLYFQEETLWISGSCTGWDLEKKLLELPENTPVTVLVDPEGIYTMHMQTETEVLLDFDIAARNMAIEAWLDIGLGVICYGAAILLAVLEYEKKLR